MRRWIGDAFVVGFTDAAQPSKTCDEYTRKIASAAPEGLRYLGMDLYKKVVNGLIGSLPLLR